MLLETDRLEEIESILKNIIRVGVVVALYPDEASVRVEFSDTDGVVSHKLPIIFSKTHFDKEYWMPDVGEEVVCLFLPYAKEVGFVIGAIYNIWDKVPVADNNKRRVHFKDGTVIEYDSRQHKLFIKSVGDIEIISDTHITLIAPRIDLNP